MKARVLLLVIGIAAVAGGPSLAHHSFAVYEREKTVTLAGTVQDYVWTNPHVTIRLVTESASRGLQTWTIEGSPPSVLARGGWTSNLLRPGDQILLGVHPRKDSTTGGYLADEQQLLVNGRPAKGVLWLTLPGDIASWQ